MVITQAGLGLRISELLGLRGDDVLWLERMVKIDVQRDRHTMGLGPLKTPGSRRKIPLPQVVTDALSQHIAQYQMERSSPWRTANRRTSGQACYSAHTEPAMTDTSPAAVSPCPSAVVDLAPRVLRPRPSLVPQTTLQRTSLS